MENSSQKPLASAIDVGGISEAMCTYAAKWQSPEVVEWTELLQITGEALHF